MRSTVALLALALLLLALPATAQQGSECSGVSANPSTVRAGAAASTRAIGIYAPPGCTFYAQATASWLRVEPAEFTLGDGSVTLTVSFDANPDDTTRSAYVEVSPRNGYAGPSIYVEQFGRCVYRILGDSSFSFPSDGGSGTILASAEGDGCVLSFGASEPWIRVGSTGDFTVDPNDGYERQGVVTIGPAGQSTTPTIFISQTGRLARDASSDGSHGEGSGNSAVDRWIEHEVEAPGGGAVGAIAGLAVAASMVARRRR